MLMEFKAGDRVRVLRFNGEDVDFYGTLKYVDKCMANLFDCTIKRNEGMAIFLPSDNSFGEDKEDYYILAEDEEDTKGGNNLPTIKRKVEMNLPELIEWGFKNDVTNTWYRASNVEEYISEVFFDATGLPQFSNTVNKNDTFTVEVVEEITLTTPLPVMLHVWKTETLGTEIKEVENKSIASQYTICSTEFWLKQGDEMTLIWKNGKLVD